MNTLTVLLIIASAGCQKTEFEETKKALESAGITVVTASNKAGQATAHDGSKIAVDVALDNLNLNNYDGVFIIGGPGALEHLDNQKVKDIMRAVAQSKKAFGAICISPRILAQAGLLTGKKATGWNGDDELPALFAKHGVIYKDKPVVVDGDIVTASGPLAAPEFGKAIVKVLTTPQI